MSPSELQNVQMTPPAAASGTGTLQLEVLRVEPGDAAQFRAALEKHAGSAGGDITNAAHSARTSLGDRLLDRASGLASGVKQDQQYVSKLLEQATRSANSLDLMKAMLAMNDYQTRVQFISKTVSKAASAVDQLTKLQ